METWHPLGVVGVISAFNFPVAVWSWNAAIALVCGDTVVWKPSPMTALTAAGVQRPARPRRRRLRRAGEPQRARRGRRARPARRSSTAPTSRSSARPARSGWGPRSRPRVAARFGRSLLELGGNNAAVVAPSADLELAARGITFSAAGTAGQRCTTMRRLIVHEDVADALVARLAGSSPACRSATRSPTARSSAR